MGIIIAAIFGGGIWFYKAKILPSRSNTSPTPISEITAAAWKVKSEKVTSDFLGYWKDSSSDTNGIQLAKKARDLLTIAAQGKIQTYKDEKGNIVTDISSQLDNFIGVKQKPANFELISSKKIDEKTVEVRITLASYAPDKIFTVNDVGGSWLIDSVRDWSGATESVSPTPQASTSPLPSP